MDEASIPNVSYQCLTKLTRQGGPVTCVSLPVNGNCFIAARGPFLERQTNSGVKQQLLVFPKGGTIRGIRYRDSDDSSWDSIVFSGRKLALCSLLQCHSEDMRRLSLFIDNDSSTIPHLTISDWIWDVKSVSGKTTTLAIGLARHIIEFWDFDSADLRIKASRRHRINGDPSCLVTSMHLMHTGNELLVAAGTAFHEIRVWKYDMTAEKSNDIQTIVASHCLRGHAGGVHSVKFASDCLSLASTSDDRSVRFWQYDQANDEWMEKWVGWGHTARVWSVAFAPSLGTVASTGEDGSIRFWSCSSGEVSGCIQHACPLWTVDTFDDFIIAGANDGTVNLYDMTSRISSGNRLTTFDAVPVPDDRPKILLEYTESQDKHKKKPKKKKKKSSNTQVIVGLKWEKNSDDGATLLVATRAGSLLRLNVGSGTWQMIEHWWTSSLKETYDINSSDGCCMSIHERSSAIGTSRGDIVLTRISFNNSKTNKVLSARTLKSVQGLKWLNSGTLISFHVRSVALWLLGKSQAKDEHVKEPNWVFELDEKTKGVPLSCSYEEERSIMIVGDSRGNLTLFLFCDVLMSITNSNNRVQPSFVLPRAHQKEHVTDIVLREDRVLSVGNDGCLHVSYLKKNILVRGWSIPASSMTGISQILSRPGDSSSSLYVAGYYGNTFRMIDIVSGHEFFQFDTGGRQRIHDCDVNFSPSTSEATELSQYGMVVCMNQKDGTNSLLISHLSKSNTEAIIPTTVSKGGISMHSETIFSACFFSIQEAHFLLTGSEDCTSKISFYESENLEDSILGLTPQESCVRAVSSSQHDDSSALLIVGGGKLIVQFFLVHSSQSGTPSSTDDLEIHYLGQFKNRDKALIDHRINNVKAIPLKGTSPIRKHLVVAGDSDGCCHIFIVSETKVEAGILVSTSPRPILCIDLLSVDDQVLVTIGTTGGDVLLFDLPGVYTNLEEHWNDLKQGWTPMATYRAHQMGTNTVHASLQNDKHVKICTGGDDQALCISDIALAIGDAGRLTLASDPNPRVIKELSFSALKGVYQVCHSGRTFVLSVGYSQQLALWELDIEGHIVLQDRASVDLGDVNCLAVDDSTSAIRIVVGGLGVEYMSLKVDNCFHQV
jgi:WD40 repeat protein